MITTASPAGLGAVEIREFGDRCHLVAHVPADHPALGELQARACRVAPYFDLKAGGRVAAYDLFFAYGSRPEAQALGAWLKKFTVKGIKK